MKIQVAPYVHTYPAPAVLIGCGTVDKPNLITCSWFGTVCSKPPTVGVSIRPTRFSYPLIRETREFTVNIPRLSQLDAVKFCGSKSGRDVDKFRELNWSPLPCEPLSSAPRAEECFISLGCKVQDQLEIGTHTLFIAEIVSIFVDEEVQRSTGRPDPKVEDQIVYLDKKYWKLSPAE